MPVLTDTVDVGVLHSHPVVVDSVVARAPALLQNIRIGRMGVLLRPAGGCSGAEKNRWQRL